MVAEFLAYPFLIGLIGTIILLAGVIFLVSTGFIKVESFGLTLPVVIIGIITLIGIAVLVIVGIVVLENLCLLF
ncbi:hypothetical protein LCGC14_2185880 [marine sediment metagenome]|uniref:Uncharacterized protein n=1 Tax=marine sediment metagenome TaxID=412755 RepID=A0A0F9FYE4_9ZZZZ